MAYVEGLREFTGVDDETDDDEKGFALQELPSFLAEFDERRSRRQSMNRIKACMDSAISRESYMIELLDWLSFTRESFEQFEQNRLQSNEMVTTEWVDSVDTALGQFLLEMNWGIGRLNVLWQSIGGRVTKTKRKDESATPGSGGNWHWWREQKVDTKTVRNIQELQPPSVEDILGDASFATKCASELSFILEDMQKSMSGNRGLFMALSFIQIGLQNLNEAFQRRTREGSMDKEQTVRDDTNKVALLTAQLSKEKDKRSRLEEKLSDLSEQNQALMFHIQNLRYKSTNRQETVMVENIPVLIETDPDFSTQQRQKPASKPQASSLYKPNSAYVGEEEAFKIQKSNGIAVQMEQRSVRLMEDFRENVLEILDHSMRQPDGYQDMKDEDRKKAERAKGFNVVKLFKTLQVSMMDCFKGIMTQIRGRCKDEILELCLQETSLFESDLWSGCDAPPGKLLRELGREIKKQDESIRNAGQVFKNLVEMQGKMKNANEQKRRHTIVNHLMEMFKNINDMEKQQACKLRLTLESLCKMHSQIRSRSKPESHSIPPPPPQPLPPPPPPPLPDLPLPPPPASPRNVPVHGVNKVEFKLLSVEEKLAEDIEAILRTVTEPEVVTETKVTDKPSKLQVQQSEISIPLPRPVSPKSRRKSYVKPIAVAIDHVDRYIKEMPEESERLQQSRLGRYNHIIDIKAQQENLNILDQALGRDIISSRLYHLARDVIVQAEMSVERRLRCIMLRFIKQCHLQQVRKILNSKLNKARNRNDGQTIRMCYGYIQNLEKLQASESPIPDVNQASVDHQRQKCFARMLYLFLQMKLDYKVDLAAPSYRSDRKNLTALTIERVKMKLTPLQQSLSSTQRGHPPISMPPSQSITKFSKESTFLPISMPPSQSITKLSKESTFLPISMPRSQSITKLSTESSFLHLPERQAALERSSLQQSKSASVQNLSDSLWQVPLINSGTWLTRKIKDLNPVRFPSLPRLFEMDVDQDRRRALQRVRSIMDGVDALKSNKDKHFGT